MEQVTNEVLLEKIKGLTNLIDQRFNENREDHDRLIAQTTKTNGRVTSLEQWRAYQTGAIAIIAVIITAIVIPVVLKLI